VLLGVLALCRSAWNGERDRPAVRTLALVSGGLFVAQALVGAALIWSSLSVGARVAHEAVGALVWAALVATSLLAFRLEPTGAARAAETRRQLRTAVPIAGGSGIATALEAPAARPEGDGTLRRVGAYVALIKPHMIIL